MASTPALQWDGVGGAANYQVQVAATDTFGNVLYDVTTPNRRAVPTAALPTGKIFWRVRSINSSNETSGWASSSFSVKQSAGPALVSPANGDSLQQPFQPSLLSWQTVRGAKSYQVEVDNAPDFVAATSTTVNTTSYLVPNPQPATTWFWRVRATDSSGSMSTWSGPWSYTIPGPLEVDQASATPADSPNTALEDVTFDWEPVPGAKDYEIRVSTDINFNTIVDAQIVKSTRYSPPVTYDNNQYWWQVRARDVSGNTRPWSDPAIPVRQFQRYWPDRPALQFPQDDSAPGDPFFFQWQPIDHASHYELNMSTDQNFSPTDESKGVVSYTCTTRATTYTPTGRAAECMPVPGRRYYWRVRGLDGPFSENQQGGVWSRWSDIHSFVYTPDHVHQVSPLPGQTVAVPTLRWQPAQDTEKYRVVVRDATGAVAASTDTFALSWTPPNKLAAGTYRWSVVPVDRDGVAGPTPTLGGQPTFVVWGQPATSGVPALTPLASEAGTSTVRAPSLAWEPNTDATYYRVYIGREGDTAVEYLKNEFGSPAAFQYPAATDINAANLGAGRYRWYVEAYGVGGYLGEGPEGHFEIAPLQSVQGERVGLTGLDVDEHFCGKALNPPGQEPNYCEDLKQTPVLDWEPVPQASHYMVYLFNDRSLTNDVYPGVPYITTQNTRWTPRTLLADSQAGDAYYWFVRPCKANGVCAPDPTSASHAFDKTSNPVEPELADSAAQQDNDLTFSWTDYLATNKVVDAEHTDATGAQSTQEAQSYRVEVSDDPTFSIRVHSEVVDQTTYTPYNVTFPEGPIYWRVQAVDGSGNGLTWSQPVALTKASAGPVLTQPTDGAKTDSTPYLRWQPTDFAASYDVQVAKNADTQFSPVNLVLFENTKQAAYTLNQQLPASVDAYVWRVRRVDADGKPGNWSKACTFNVQGQVPQLLVPETGRFVGSTSSYFTWEPTPGAISYRFEIQHEGEAPLAGVTFASAYAPRLALTDGSWKWRVSSLDAAGNALGTSAWRSFEVDSRNPTIIGKSPGSRTRAGANWVVTFSEPVVKVGNTTMKLFRAGRTKSVAARITRSNSGRTWTLNPSVSMAGRVRYTLKLTSGITDRAGNRLAATSYSSTPR